jgi:hypothetical protein
VKLFLHRLNVHVGLHIRHLVRLIEPSIGVRAILCVGNLLLGEPMRASGVPRRHSWSLSNATFQLLFLLSTSLLVNKIWKAYVIESVCISELCIMFFPQFRHFKLSKDVMRCQRNNHSLPTVYFLTYVREDVEMTREQRKLARLVPDML